MMRLLLCACLCAASLLHARSPLLDPVPIPFSKKPGESEDAAMTVVIYNQNFPQSEELARLYAEKRGVPKDQVVAIDCPAAEEISRDDYERRIAEPLRRTFIGNGWWRLRESDALHGRLAANKIRFIALIRGVPLKITPATNYPGDKATGQPPLNTRNEASVDSEIAVLGAFIPHISGIVNNPYFRSFQPIKDSGYVELMLVCRLDGPSPETVTRMITDSIAAEKEGLRGFAYVDARGIKQAGFDEGDKWLFRAAAAARKHGTPVILDEGEGLFPDGYPMRHAAFYFGWYSDKVAGPFTRPGFRFERGAVACHIHSFSASTVREPGRGWVAPLLGVGAAAVLGNVYEPYLGLTPHLDIFFDRLRAGFTFAESAWMSQRVASWVTTFVGDPLYRPFKNVAPPRSTNEWDIYRDGARTWFNEGREAGEKALELAGRKRRSGVIMEGLGLLELSADRLDVALAAFRDARKFYTATDDILRATIHEVILLHGMKRDAEALPLVRAQANLHAGAPAVEVLRMLEASMVPPATPQPRRP